MVSTVRRMILDVKVTRIYTEEFGLDSLLSTDVAISCPFGGEEQQGLVYIYNGYSEGLSEKPSQVIAGQWAAGSIPASFGFALRGAKDLDMNGYPGGRRGHGVLFKQSVRSFLIVVITSRLRPHGWRLWS